MRTRVEIRFIARSPKTKPTYQTQSWSFRSKKDAKNFVKSLHIADYTIDTLHYVSYNYSKKSFRYELV